MRTQPAEKLEKNLLLAFENESNKMICSLEPLAVQQFVNNFHLGKSSKIKCNVITCRPCLSFMQHYEKCLLYLNSVYSNLFCTNKCFQTSLLFRPIDTLIIVSWYFWALVEFFRLYANPHFGTVSNSLIMYAFWFDYVVAGSNN